MSDGFVGQISSYWTKCSTTRNLTDERYELVIKWKMEERVMQENEKSCSF